MITTRRCFPWNLRNLPRGQYWSLLLWGGRSWFCDLLIITELFEWSLTQLIYAYCCMLPKWNPVLHRVLRARMPSVCVCRPACTAESTTALLSLPRTLLFSILFSAHSQSTNLIHISHSTSSDLNLSSEHCSDEQSALTEAQRDSIFFWSVICETILVHQSLWGTSQHTGTRHLYYV